MIYSFSADCTASSITDTSSGVIVMHAACRHMLSPASQEVGKHFSWSQLLVCNRMAAQQAKGCRFDSLAGIPQLCSLAEGNAGSGQQALH